MSRKIEFYTIAFYSDDCLVQYSVQTFFEKIEKLLIAKEKVTRNIREHYVRVFPFYRHDFNKNVIIIPFGKLKDKNKPYWINENNNKLEEFSRDLYDLNSIGYDFRNRIMVLTTNKSGPSAGLIEEYLNTFIPESLGIKIRLEEIIYNSGLAQIRKAQLVRAVVLTLNLSVSLKKFYSNKIAENNETGLIKAVYNMATAAKSDGNGKALTIALSVGQGGKEETLDLNTMLQLLEDINIDGDFVKEIAVKYKDGTEEKVDQVKLKNSSVKVNYLCKGGNSQVSPEELLLNIEEAVTARRKYFAPCVRDRLDRKEQLIAIEDFEMVR